jgi:spore germination protein KC
MGDLATVSAAGVDLEEDGSVRLTVQVIKPGELKPAGAGGGGGSGAKAVALFSSGGPTVFEAVRVLARQTERKLYWPHCRVVVFSEEAARAGLFPLMDFFYRDHEPREALWIMVTKGQAGDLLAVEGQLEKIPATSIANLIKARAATSQVVGVRLFEWQKMFFAEGQEPFLPGIEQITGPDGKNRLFMSDTAVFQKDRLVGWLSPAETRGLLWVLGDVKSGIIVVPIPGEESAKASLEILRASSKLVPEIKDGILSITVEVEAEGNLGEQMGEGNLTTKEAWAALEKSKAEAIEKEIRAALRKAQEELRTDVFGFGAAVRRKHPQEWREIRDKWQEIYPTIPVEIEVKTKLRRPGLTD